MKRLLTVFACACCGVAVAGTYYKLGTDAAGKSSFAGNVSGTIGWGTAKGASSTTTVSDWANSDFIVDGTLLRTPATDTAVTFGGRTLTLTGGGTLMFKKANNGGDRHVTVTDLRVTGTGNLSTGQDTSQFTLEGNVALAENAVLKLLFGLSSASDDWRYLVMRAKFSGPTTSSLTLTGSGLSTKTQSAQLTLEDAADFLGTIADGGGVRNFTLRLTGGFGGSITALPSETVGVIVNYDGLDPETGLRVLSTTIPTPLLTKLSFYSPTTDIFTAGRKLLTFPKETEVDPAAFTIKTGTSVSASTAKPLSLLGVVTNADETISLVTKQGPVLYKVGSDPVNYTSFTTNYTSAIGWSTTEGATTTTPFSAATFAASECILGSGLTLRTPADATDITFMPHLLRLRGHINTKSYNAATITYPNLIAEGGSIGNGNGGFTYTIAGQITIADGKTMSFSTVDTDARTIHVTALVRGNAGTGLIVIGGGTGSGYTTFSNLADFRGELSNTAKSSVVDITGAFAGTIGALDNDPTLRVNYDGLPANTGLRITATTIPNTLKTKLRFYSATRNFGADGLPLLSFPAGTTVTPSDFSIVYASSSTDTATTFPALKVVTGENGEVILAVDAKTPVTAKYLPTGDGTFSWYFYGAGDEDVTATCGLTAPTSAITVYIENSEQYEALKSVTYTAKATRIASFEATADTDLTAASPAFTADTGAIFDVKGHTVDFPTSLFSGSKATTVQLVKNGGFEENSIASGAAVSMTPTSWSRSGNAILLKNSTDYANLEKNGSIWCYLPSGANISQTIVMPADGRCSYSLNYATKNWSGYYGASSGNVLLDGTAIVTWSGMGNYYAASASGTVALTAGKHTLTIRCTSGYGINVDNISLTTTTPSATVTDSVGGGTTRVTVPSGSTVSNAGVLLKGNQKFVKAGAGTFVSARIGQKYSGGNEIVAGTLATTAGSGSNVDFAASREPLGALNNEIVVRTNATLNITGNYDYGAYHIILDGGILRSSTIDDKPIVQPSSSASWGAIGWITLTADSTFYLRSDTVFNGWNSHCIDLGGHELTVNAPIDSKYIYWNKAITNGTLRLNGVSTAKEYFMTTGAVDAKTVDVIDRMGIHVANAFSVRGYNPTRTWDNALCTGTAALNVYGTFRPDSDYFYGCTLQDGATLDLSGKTATWSVQSAATVGRTVVDFANNANVQLKLEGRRAMSSCLVDWQNNTPTNLATLAFTIDPVKKAEGYRIYWNEKGIFAVSGTLVIVR